MKIIVYTANIGYYDYYTNIKESDIDFFYFTDTPVQLQGWKNKVIKKNYDNVRLARYIKCNPHLVLPQHDISIWIDAKFRVRPENIRNFVDNNFTNDDIACYYHYRNKQGDGCLYEEGEVCSKLNLDDKTIISNQLNKYKKEGFPSKYGLYDTGIILRRNKENVNTFNEKWWNEIKNGSKRDQLSQMYVAWKTGIKIKPLKGSIYRSELIQKMKHIHKDMKKHDIINKYIRKYGYTDYLEIGVRHGITYNNIECDNKVGIDPNSNFDKMIDSDSFFSSLDKKFDIVFIDGLHTDEQLEKDILNSLDHLTENGTIVCHDCNPQSEISQRVPRETKHWNGSCWKAIVRLRRDRDDLEVFTINTDEGCAVIRRGKQKTLSIKSDLTYQNLEKNRIEWLNLISVNDWLQKITNEKEKTTYRIYQFQPYALDGNYGAEVRYYCDLVKNEEDWIIIADYDVMCLTTHHIHKIKQYIDAYPDTGMFLPYTNRVKQMNQVLDKNLFEDPNILTHKNKADEIDNKQHFGVTEIHHVISGYFMVFKKSTYTKVGIPDGLLGVDNRFSKRILEAGMKIRMMNSIYAFHYYRFKTGINNKNHLKNIKT